MVEKTKMQNSGKIFEMKRDKRGDKVISVYWFAILFIVAAAIAYMVAIFYGEPYDVREIEANIMVNKVADCLAQSGYLNEKVMNETFKNNFLAECKLNFNVEDIFGWKKEGQYYLEVNYLEVNILGFTDDKSFFNVTEGNLNLKDYCKNKGQKNFPTCVEREFYSLDKNKQQYKIKILSVVRKIEKNVQ